MKKVSFSKSRLSKALAGKGFYVALCFSLVAIGAAAFVAYNRTVNRLEEDPLAQVPETTTTSYNEWNYPEDTEDVNASQADVPKDTTTTAQTTQATEVNLPVRNNTLKVMPISGEIVNGFSNGELVKSKTLGTWKTHDGVDIAAAAGDSVKAMMAGNVTEIKEDPLWGVCILIDHGNGIEGHYYNLGPGVVVKVDQTVAAGDVIGTVGQSAEIEIAEVPHLHFGVKENGKWIDPIAFIGPTS